MGPAGSGMQHVEMPSEQVAPSVPVQEPAFVHVPSWPLKLHDCPSEDGGGVQHYRTLVSPPTTMRLDGQTYNCVHGSVITADSILKSRVACIGNVIAGSVCNTSTGLSVELASLWLRFGDAALD